MSPRKAVFINRFFFPDHSATSQMLSDLAFDLAAQGLSVQVITSRLRYDDATAQLPAHETVQGVVVHRVWTTRFGRGRLLGRAADYLSFYFSATWMLWRCATRDTVVVIKTDPPLLAITAVPVARLRGAKWVNWLQDLFPEVASALGVGPMRGPLLWLTKKARNLTLRGAHANVVLGQVMAQRLRAEMGAAGKAMVLKEIPNWADGRAIQPVPHADNPLRRAWALDGRFVVGYSGNLGRAHEFETVLSAAELLQARYPEVVFLLIGDGAQRQAVQATVNSRGLVNVQFKPYQPREQLSLSLGVADVHLVSLNPALEGLIVPSKFYGVAAAGRATLFIGDTDGEIARLLRQAQCGFSTAAGDGATLARQIQQLAGDQVLCQTMGQNARALLLARFDRRIAVAAWKELLLQ